MKKDNDALYNKLKTILHSSFSQILLMMSQNLVNIVDMFIVGIISLSALGAVGLCSFIYSITASGLTGIMIGVQSVVAKKKGEDDHDNVITGLQSGILIALILGICIIVADIIFVPQFVNYFIKDELLAKNSIEYLQALLLTAPAMGIVRAFRGYYGGIGKNKISLFVTICIHLSNASISYMLVYFGFGIRGVGLGTAISYYLGTLIFFFYGYYFDNHFTFRKTKSFGQDLKKTFQLSYTAGVQQFFFTGGFAFMFLIASRINSESLAIITVLNNLMLLSVMPLLGLGISASSFVGRSLGGKMEDEAKKWGDSALIIGFFVFLLQLFILFFPERVMLLFLKDLVLVTKYVSLYKLTLLFIFFEIFAQILKYSMFGAGYNRQIAIMTISFQWILFIPVAYYLCIVKGESIRILWFSFLIYRALEGIFMVVVWNKKNWIKYSQGIYKKLRTTNI